MGDGLEAVNQFRDAMRAAGLETTAEIIADGKIHRFHVEGDSRDKENGWYILHVDERPAGQFGSWKTGVSETWTAKVDRKLSVTERKELERRISQQRAEREKEETRVQAEAAERANRIWNESDSDVPFDHKYLQSKGIKPVSIRHSRNALVVPMRSGDGELWSLQFISDDGEKRYLSGGRKLGCYATLPGKTNPYEPLTIAICEGYATGVSINAATDFVTAVTFDTSNLEHVARVLRGKYPDARLIICADNDEWTTSPVKNPGVFYGTKAAEAVSAILSFPRFLRKSSKPTDFNDLAQLEGLERVFGTINDDIIVSQAEIHSFENQGGSILPPEIIPPDHAPPEGFPESGPYESELEDEADDPESIEADTENLFIIFEGLAAKQSLIASQLVQAARGRIVYDDLRNRFYVFNKVWRLMTDGDIQRRIQRVFNQKMAGGYNAGTLKQTFVLFQLAIGHGKDNLLEWDERGYLPCQNGLLNLNTRQLESFDMAKKIDWILPYDYTPGVECPTFDLLIERLSCGDESSKRLLIVFLAAIVRCRSDLQKYLELVGAPGSGKSSYMRVAQMLVGEENIVSSNMRNLGGNRFETAGFYGKRLAIFPDEREHVSDGTDVFKAITGGDGIRYEQKNQQQSESFRFDGMVIVACNSPMTFEDYSGAIPRRRMTVHIEYSLTDADRDPDFIKKLSTEMPGVLNKLLAITDEEINNVLLDRDSARAGAAKRALIETNPIYAWFDQRIILDVDHTSYVGSLKRDGMTILDVDLYLYPNFIEWLESNGRRSAITLHKFTATLRELVRTQSLPVSARARTMAGVPWQGLRLRLQYDFQKPTPITAGFIGV